MLIQKITAYDDQVIQMRAFVSAREDVITYIDKNCINKKICAYLDNHILHNDISSFLGKLVEVEQEDIESLKHDECYEAMTTWDEDFTEMQSDLARISADSKYGSYEAQNRTHSGRV